MVELPKRQTEISDICVALLQLKPSGLLPPFECKIWSSSSLWRQEWVSLKFGCSSSFKVQATVWQGLFVRWNFPSLNLIFYRQQRIIVDQIASCVTEPVFGLEMWLNFKDLDLQMNVWAMNCILHIARHFKMMSYSFNKWLRRSNMILKKNSKVWVFPKVTNSIILNSSGPSMVKLCWYI